MTDFRTTWAFQYRGVPLDLGAVITPETAADHHEVQLGWNIGAVAPVDPDAPIDPPLVEPPDGGGDQIEPMTSADGPTRNARHRR